jgi:flavin reductase (DIM6/NTAB) family NADH-FMN oxidoreductase RutF
VNATQSALAKPSRELRDAFGCFATGVAVVTCAGPSGSAVAVTINSFVSISLDPPIVSFALGRDARCLAAFLADDQFTVHVLQERQLDLAKNFARPATSSWAGIGHRKVNSGHVLFDQYAAAFLCHRLNQRHVGDHVVLNGEVTRFHSDVTAAPLVFCHGRYGAVHLSCPRHALSDEGGWSDHIARLAWG